ncbi:hypothetical protein PS706_01756 [Pseudomonas fluorescens]|nr:hypothetical protein PS706_01756 [Pseudomonas fluorescens]
MSVIQVQNALQHFAKNKASRAVVLKGEWGTGKTFVWNEVIKNHRKDFARSSYSYVSLFGLSSLADLKRAIFTNIVKKDIAGHVATTESIKENLMRLDFTDARAWLRKATGQTKDVKLPLLGGIGSIVDSMQFASISDTLVCIDDFERKSNSLTARDVLGLISNLVEGRQCSVILILNDNSLDEDDEFFTFNEKVFDYEVVYKPAVEECVNIVLPACNFQYALLSKNIKKLKISNIRLLKKIDLFYGLLQPHLKHAPDEIIEKAMVILPLAIFALYGSSVCPVDVDFISQPSARIGLMPLSKDATQEERNAQNALMAKVKWLNEYGFYYADELDLAVIALVKRGYADEEELELLLIALEASIQHNKDMKLLSDAWDVLNGSFSDNQDEVIATFEKALTVCMSKMNIRDVDSVCWLYGHLGLNERVNEIIEAHFEAAKANGWYKHKREVRGWPETPLLASRLDAYFDTQVADIPISELMDKAYMHEGFVPSVLREFKKKTPNEFYEYFKTATHQCTTEYVGNCLETSNTTYSDDNSNEANRHVFLCTYRAIQRLGAESTINKIRFGRFKKYDSAYLMILEEVRDPEKWS